MQVREWGFDSQVKLETLCCLMKEVGAKSKFMTIILIFPWRKVRFRDTDDTPESQDNLNGCEEDIPISCLLVYEGTSLLFLFFRQLREERG